MLVTEALKSVQRILDVNRKPRLASEVDHEYVDKYALADLLTNTTIIAQMNVLERLGLSKDALKKIDTSKPVTLRFAASDFCSLLKEQTVDVHSPASIETAENTETSGSFFGSTKKSTIHTIVKHVKEYHWEVKAQWEISIYSGTDIDNRMILEQRSGSMIVVVQSETPKAPLPAQTNRVPIEVSLTWLMKQIDIENLTSQFRIKTDEPDTKTPRRNKNIEAAMEFMSSLDAWVSKVRTYFVQVLQIQAVDKHNPVKPSVSEGTKAPNLVQMTAIGVFVPVLPLMEAEPPKEEFSPTSSNSMLRFQISNHSVEDRLEVRPRVLSSEDTIRFLDEQIRTLEVTHQSIAETFPGRQLLRLISMAEASICVLCLHSVDISNRYRESMDYVESMLENQLIAAIGKRVCSLDLEQFVRYHNARFLNPPPKAFCHSIRRPEHFPEGILSIESAGKDGKMDPIETHVREVDSASGLKMALNSATTVELTGKKFLHGWLNHSFQDTTKSFEMISRARQFSSFMLVVGTMVGHDRLQPKDAIVIRDKDEVKIPLLLNEIPSSKEFKDAIASLSPEQQRFAKAYRSMQLESSVLGICVIQIKPQLEDLLGLPHDSLTKEMKLTQELMELFVDYQVPSDLLSYDGANNEATTSDMVKSVEGNVQAVMSVIEGAKNKQLGDQVLKTDMAMEKRLHQMIPEILGSSDSAAPESDLIVGGRVKKSAPVFLQGAAPSFGAGPTLLGAAPQSTSFERRRALRESAAPRGRRLAETASHAVGVSNPPASLASFVQSDGQDDWAVKSNPEYKVKGEQTGDVGGTLDFTVMPKILDKSIELYDKDGALRSTTINTSDRWTRNRQENLLTKPTTQILGLKDIKTEKEKAFDLLDALSRSGSLPIAYSELHVIICVTHRFENDVMGTVIRENINPIEKLEMSTLLVAATVLGVSANDLLRHDSDRARLSVSIPALLEASSDTT